MIELVKNNIQDVERICKEHSVKLLCLFGSAAEGNFDAKHSDLDFVVEFTEAIDPLDYADNFFSLLESLKALFKLEVDLLSYRSLNNQVIKSEIARSQVQLYAA